MPYASTESPSRSSFTLCGKLLCIAGLVFTLVGAKVFFVRNFGSMVPYWDQWDGEADLLYKSYINSTLSFAKLLSSHNEHRILTTRVFSLALFELDGGWDPMLQMIANAVLHVGVIILLVLIIQRIIRPTQFLLLAVFSTLLFVLPIGWENLLAGFQSQFYFLLMFSLLALIGLASATAFSIGWWAGVLCLIAAYFSMASGALTAVAALAVVVMQMFSGRRKGSREYIAGVALLVVAGLMILFVQNVPPHEIYKAHNVTEFVQALIRCLTYPRTNPYVGIWVNLPLVGYACAVLKVRPARQSPHWIIFGIGIWLFGQSLSLSYGRAALVNSSRYLDLIIIGLPVNFGILLFVQNWLGTNKQKTVAVLATIAWLAVVVPGLVRNTLASSFPAVVEKGAQGREQERNVLAYMKTGNLAELQGKSFLAIPYVDPVRLASLLSDPTVRLVLPDPIRPPDVDEKQRLDRTLLKGKFRSITVLVKETILSNALVMIGLGIAFAFGAGMTGQSRTSSKFRREMLPPGVVEPDPTRSGNHY
jgi:hypothetical protein